MTREEAIEIAESGIWQEWSADRIVGLFLFDGEGRLFCPIDVLYASLRESFGRPVYTHELAESNIGNIREEFLRDREPPTLEEILDLIPEEKLIILDLTKDEEPSDIGEINWKVDDSAD